MRALMFCVSEFRVTPYDGAKIIRTSNKSKYIFILGVYESYNFKKLYL